MPVKKLETLLEDIKSLGYTSILTVTAEGKVKCDCLSIGGLHTDEAQLQRLYVTANTSLDAVSYAAKILKSVRN